jgi:C4-dicarboxylate transporter DctM subunit
MDPLLLIVLILGSFLVLIVLRVPVGLAIIIPALPIGLFLGFNPIEILFRFKTPLENSALLAIFTFIALGVFMEKAGIAEALVGFVDSIIGFISGGLGITVVIASAFYGALTGSVTGTIAAIGSITIPQMSKRGYPGPFSAAVAACAGILGSLIPPSIAAIIYGVLTNTSIVSLFMAYLGPGLVYTMLLSLAVYLVSRRKGYKGHGVKATPLEAVKSFVRIIPALLIPVAVLGCIYLGVTSSTESGILGTALTVIIGLSYYHMKPKVLIESVQQTILVTGMIMFIVCSSFALSYIVAYMGLLRATAGFITGLSSQLWVSLLAVNILLLIVGMFLEGAAILVLLAPTIHQMLTTAGMDPLQVSSIVVFTGMVGFLTPPIGTALFTAAGVSGERVESIVSHEPPLFAASVVTLLLVNLVPAISVFIPHSLGLY